MPRAGRRSTRSRVAPRSRAPRARDRDRRACRPSGDRRGGPVEAPIEDGGGPPRRIAGDDAGPGMAAPLERAGLEQGDGHAQRRTRVQRDGRRLTRYGARGCTRAMTREGLGDARDAQEDQLTGRGRAAEALDRDVGRCHHERRGAQTAQGVRAPDGNLEAPLRRAPCGGGQRRVDDERRERREPRSRNLVDGHERRDDPERRRDLVGERARREVPRWDGHHRGPRPEGNGQARGDDDHHRGARRGRPRGGANAITPSFSRASGARARRA